MKYIVIAFTLKGQNFSDIKPALEDIAKNNPDATLVHGFMPKEVVEQKGFSTDVVDTLNELFPEQKSFYGEDGPDRKGMKNFAYDNQATVFVIGNITEGVKEEVIGYIKAGINLVFINLGIDYKTNYPRNELKTMETQNQNTAAQTSTSESTEPVNPTNPNALENQPSGNGNAKSLLADQTNTEKDSNAAGGTNTPQEQADKEPSLSSSPEAIGAANLNKSDVNGENLNPDTNGANTGTNTGTGTGTGTDGGADQTNTGKVTITKEDITKYPVLTEKGIKEGDVIPADQYKTLTSPVQS